MKTFSIGLAIVLTGSTGIFLLGSHQAPGGDENRKPPGAVGEVAERPNDKESNKQQLAKDGKAVCATVCGFSTAQPAWVELKRAAREASPLKISVPVKTKDGVRIKQIQTTYSKSRAILDVGKKWETGQTLVVEFLDHTDDAPLLEKVARYASEWLLYANLRMEFPQVTGLPASGPAQIRITFEYPDGRNGGGLSAIGTEALKTTGPTMLLNVETGEEGIKKLVRHEFGHALGFLHEHQHPQGVRWKQPEAMEYWRKLTGGHWTDDYIRKNVFDAPQGTNLVASVFDRYSVMMYQIPPQITEDNLEVALNAELSEFDQKGAAYLYPVQVNRNLQMYLKATPGSLKNGLTVCALAAHSPLRHLRDAAGRSVTFKTGSTLRALGNIEIKNMDDLNRAVDKAGSHFQLSYFDPEQNALIRAVGPEKGNPQEWPNP